VLRLMEVVNAGRVDGFEVLMDSGTLGGVELL
jgi:hypothetical protein